MWISHQLESEEILLGLISILDCLKHPCLPSTNLAFSPYQLLRHLSVILYPSLRQYYINLNQDPLFKTDFSTQTVSLNVNYISFLQYRLFKTEWYANNCGFFCWRSLSNVRYIDRLWAGIMYITLPDRLDSADFREKFKTTKCHRNQAVDRHFFCKTRRFIVHFIQISVKYCMRF